MAAAREISFATAFSPSSSDLTKLHQDHVADKPANHDNSKTCDYSCSANCLGIASQFSFSAVETCVKTVCGCYANIAAAPNAGCNARCQLSCAALGNVAEARECATGCGCNMAAPVAKAAPKAVPAPAETAEKKEETIAEGTSWFMTFLYISILAYCVYYVVQRYNLVSYRPKDKTARLFDPQDDDIQVHYHRVN